MTLSGGVIREGDPLVILVVEGWKRRKYYVKPRRGASYATFAGVLRGSEIIGKPWGYSGRLGRSNYYLLPPVGPELVEEFGVRRSQVIYSKDSAFIAYKAGVRPGSRVFEAGVGSGFLTIAIATMLCPTGMVYGVEKRRDMLEAARSNIEASGFSECVSLRLGDIRNGVGVEGLDAGFLDMPDPWEALDASYKALKPGAVLAVFIPTVNQLARLIEETRKHGGFVVYEVGEVLYREWEPVEGAVRPSPRMTGHTGFIAFLRRLYALENAPDNG
ncbi:MAG: tRNA (adenine-N1)-methyltransferase [Desulfurococcales archaeon]|nr:tRNA (adenine-N1)-methyltransferase [Desulfurococcales archaeon]